MPGIKQISIRKPNPKRPPVKSQMIPEIGLSVLLKKKRRFCHAILKTNTQTNQDRSGEYQENRRKTTKCRPQGCLFVPLLLVGWFVCLEEVVNRKKPGCLCDWTFTIQKEWFGQWGCDSITK